MRLNTRSLNSTLSFSQLQAQKRVMANIQKHWGQTIKPCAMCGGVLPENAPQKPFCSVKCADALNQESVIEAPINCQELNISQLCESKNKGV